MGKQLKRKIRWQQNANMNFADDGNYNWYIFVTAITHLLPAMMSFLQDEMENIFDAVVKQFGRRTLCPEATTDDLKFVKGAEFNHICSGSPFPCNSLLAIIVLETQLNDDCITMLKGTDPQSWLTSPFEFSKLFLDEWTRSKLTGFDDFDITAIGQLVRRIKRLKQMFDENGFSYLLDARNKAMHSPTLKMSETELEQNFDAMLSFLNHDRLNGRSDVVQAIIKIKKLRSGNLSVLPGMVEQWTQGWHSDAKREFEHKSDVVTDLYQNIRFMENEMDRLTSGQEAATKISKAKTRLEEEEQKRKITNLKAEIRNLEEEMKGEIANRQSINRRFAELENKLPILGVVVGVVGGLVSLLDGPASMVAVAVAGSALGALAGGVTGGATRVLGMHIDTSTKENCREGIQRLKEEIRDRRQSISYLAREIADLERVLSNI